MSTLVHLIEPLELTTVHLSRVCANVIATVFMILNLSPLMSVIFNIPAAVICAVCRRFLLGRMSRLMVIFLDCCYKGSEKADTMDKRRAPYFVSLRQYPIKT